MLSFHDVCHGSGALFGPWGLMVDLYENAERYSKVALEAVYFEAKVKFEVEMKPGYRSSDYAMVDHYVMDELNGHGQWSTLYAPLGSLFQSQGGKL